MQNTALRILFVDDEPQVLEAMTANLRKRFTVVTAADGATALEMLAQEPRTDVIVADMRMPIMNGAEFLARSRALAPDAVRMLLTGYSDVQSAARAVNEGQIARFLTKPCPVATLIQAIDDAVAEKHEGQVPRQLLERRLETVAAQLVRADKLAALGTMAGAMGHEINNVLAAFAFSVGMIRDQAFDGLAAEPADLSVLDAVGAQLRSHAASLLRLGQPLRVEPTASSDLVAGVHGALCMLHAGAVPREVQLDVDGTATPLLVALSRGEIEQIVVNMVKNAIQAMTGAATTAPRISVGCTATDDGASAVLIVADNGPGIPRNLAPLIFELYYTTKPEDQGTGLGLYVARKLITRAGGEIALAAPDGPGATFVVTLPIARN